MTVMLFAKLIIGLIISRYKSCVAVEIIIVVVVVVVVVAATAELSIGIVCAIFVANTATSVVERRIVVVIGGRWLLLLWLAGVIGHLCHISAVPAHRIGDSLCTAVRQQNRVLALHLVSVTTLAVAVLAQTFRVIDNIEKIVTVWRVHNLKIPENWNLVPGGICFGGRYHQHSRECRPAERLCVCAMARPLDMEPYDAVRYHANRTRRQLSSWVSSLALPPRSIVSIAPRFGWLLYQGSDVEEELDFVLQSEFIYRFPEHETAHSHNTSDSHHGRHESPSHVTHSDWAGQQPTVHYVDHVASASAPHAMALNFDHNWQLQTQWQAADASSGGAARSRRSTSTAQSKRNSRMAADKVTLYKAFENVMSLMGVDGRACLLQAICEITNKPLLYDGIVGELLNLLLLPSHTNGEHSLLTDFVKTEQLVREAAAAGDRSSCASRYPSCRLALFEHSTAHLS